MVLITKKNWGGGWWWGWGSSSNPSQFDSIEWWYVYYAETDTGVTQITRYDLVDYHRMIAMWERDDRTTLTYNLP